jgi:hypothetical protein
MRVSVHTAAHSGLSKGNDMNAKQAKVLETVATKNWIDWKFSTSIDGELKISTQEIGDKVFVQVSNVGCQWYEKFVIVQMLIGTRGGVSKLKLIN